MKQTPLILAALLFAYFALLSPTVQAQQVTSYNEGDLFVGFEQQNGSGGVTANNYVIDLGSVRQFIEATSTITVNIPTAALVSAFGSSWAANTGNLVQWGVVGGSDTDDPITLDTVTLQKNTLFYTQSEVVVGTQSPPPATASSSIQGNMNGNIQQFGLYYQGRTETTQGVNGVVIPTSDPASWSVFTPSSSAFGSGKNIEQPTSGSFTGPTNSQLDLYQLNNTTKTPGSTAIYLGHFNLSSGGALTFTPANSTAPTQLSFNDWTTKYSTSGPTTTPENDAVPNLLKFLFGIDPTRPMTAADRAALPEMGMDASQDITLTYGQSSSAGGVTVNVQTSTDLRTWTTLTSTQYTQQPTGTNDPNGDPYIEVVVPNHAQRLFVRLSVVLSSS